MDRVFDVAIIGGGINGCGCAADAALRGLSVILLEKDDLASKTSSSSTKLIHGGLRYLEGHEFKLVKKALEERQTLLNLAPHLVHPQPFILPYQKHMRPAWFLRLGLFIYDHLSRKNKLPKTKTVRRKNKKDLFAPLKDNLKQGFMFYDASTDDARLTIVNAIQAENSGANIRPHHKVIKTESIDNIWHITVQPTHGQSYTVRAKALVNAAGPWVDSIAQLTNNPIHQSITLIKGSHIVVPAIYEGNHAYFLQHEDNRVVFIIPYFGFSMIGTTDVPFIGNPDDVKIDNHEINYLLSLINTYLNKTIRQDDILYTWSGVRPLLSEEGKKAQSITRDYRFELTTVPAPAVTIYGGKITTYRQLAAEAIDQLVSVFPNMPKSVTKSTPLPGAILGTMSFTQYATYAREKYHWMQPVLLQRLLSTYGTSMELFLNSCRNEHDLGKCFGNDLYQVEVDYLILEEWARDCDDILYRRTKLGLTMDPSGRKELADYLANITTRPEEVEPILH